MSQEVIDRENRNAVRRILRAVGRIRFRSMVAEEIVAAYARGYNAAHEDQMQMRIRDAKEAKLAKSK